MIGTKNYPLEKHPTYLVASKEISIADDPDDLKAVTKMVNNNLEIDFWNFSRQSTPVPACSSGCHYCCHVKVDVFPGEIFLIADCVKKLDAKQQEQIYKTATDNAAKIAPMTLKQHEASKIRCPLLGENKSCLIYPDRPFVCRRYHSANVQTCITDFNSTAEDGQEILQNKFIIEGLSSKYKVMLLAYNRAGYDANAYDINSALIEALTDKDCEMRWFNKKPALLKAARPKDANGRS